jgi:pimeloyl-ACP methyl ester carboxylesterase
MSSPTPPAAAPQWFLDAIAYAPQRRSVPVSGCQINYLVWGDADKPPLVLVHGGAAHAMWWSIHARALAQHYYVIAPDLSGHGDSGRRDSYPKEIWAEEVVTVAEHAAPGRLPVLVGHSMGGLVSIVAAAVYGAPRLTGAVIVDAPVRRPDPESVEGNSGRAFRSPGVYPDLQSALPHFRLIPPQPCEHGFILEHIARHSLVQTPEGWTWKFDPRVFLRYSGTSVREHLAQVNCRVALMRGEFSAIVSPESGAYMYEQLKRNAPLVEIPQAHHHLILDQPLAFIAALRALLADWDHSVPRR